ENPMRMPMRRRGTSGDSPAGEGSGGRGPVRLASEEVADAGLGQQVGGVRWVALELLAQVADVGAKVLDFVPVLRAPDLGQELIVGDDAPALAGQRHEEAELGRRQVDVFATAC